MTHASTLHYTNEIVRTAVFGFWRRTAGGLIVVWPLCALLLLGLWYRGFTPWWVLAFGAVIVLTGGLAAALFLVHYAGSMRRFHALADQAVLFRAEENSFTLEAPMGTTTFNWSVVKELWKFKDCWLILYSKAQFNTLPLADIPQEMRTFVELKIRSAGGKVIG